MCLAVIEWSPTSTTPLKIIANRDEFRNRPSDAMHWWFGDELLAGKDLQAGGTWLGFNRNKDFALLTNIRPGFVGVQRPRSRGQLVSEFLTGDFSIEHYHQRVIAELDSYGGFNLVLFSQQRLFWFSSHCPQGQWLTPGIHALSNDSLNTPWPKVELAKQQMKDQSAKISTNQLTGHSVLHSTAQASQQSLPSTGVPLEWEKILSAQTIIGSEYGTRCRTNIVIDEHTTVRVVEEQINEHGTISSSQYFEF